MFEQVVFAGGGHRCWWQAGFWDRVAADIDLRPKVIAGASAGAATACLLYAGNTLEALDYYDQLLTKTARNFYWSNLFKRGQKVMPHDQIYRTALSVFFDDAHYKQVMWNAPQIRVVYSLLPNWLGASTGALIGLAAYSTEKYLFQPLHPKWGRRLGFKPAIGLVQDCKSPQELIALLMASACTPPITQIEYIKDEATLDGGMVDNVPVHAVDEHASTLVLLSRQYGRHAPIFSRNGLIYVQPSQKLPASSWDYTNPSNYRDTYQLGRKDGISFLRSFRSIRPVLN